MKYKKRVIPKNIQIIVVLTIFSALWVVLLCSYKTNVRIVLNGQNEVKVLVNKAYNDLGFKLFDEDKEIKDVKYTKSSNVNITKLGEYKYSYEITYKNKKYYLERKVIVVDEIAPELVIDTKEITRDYCSKKDTNSLKYSAIDNYDGDITEKVLVSESDNKYVLSVEDSSNNRVEKEIPIKYSNKPNDSLKLNGSKNVYVKLNETYKEKGANYTSGCNIKSNVKINIDGEVDTTKVGTYTLTYSYNGKSVKRKVVVYEPNKNPTNGNKIIYLTFDDGPSKYTPKLLDILDKYNVKATFFVVGTNRNTIAEEYKRGHTIGVHTLTHNWSVYKSLDSYLTDFNKMNDIIEEKTGSRSMIFRFPGGSSNTVSRKYSKGIVKKIANYMTEAGYVYFDWNVSAGDASSNTGEQVYNNVVNGVRNCTKCVILMHDSKQKTVNQVENILKTFIERGYTFATLDTNGPIVHHAIKN